MKVCSVPGCTRGARSKGMCAMHYTRVKRHGDPNIVKAPISTVPWLDEMDDYGHTFDPADERHGTENGYKNLGCRCARCREANTVKHHTYMNADPERLAKHRQREKARRDRLRQQRQSS